MGSSAAVVWLVPSCLVLGSLGALLFVSLPPAWVWWLLAGCGALSLLSAPTRWVGALLLACCWSLWNFQLRLEDRLAPELSGQVMQVSGVISSMPQTYDDYVSFRFKPRVMGLNEGYDPRLPRTLLLRWYEEWPELSTAQHWNFELLLKPPWGSVNFQGSDREKWLFASGVGGVGTVRGGHLEADAGAGGQWLAAWRESVFQQISARLADRRTAGIVQALAVADRSGLAREDRQLLATTGTSHLLAISGLHIGLAAGGGVLLTRWLGWFLPIAALGRGFHLLGLTGGALAAGAYAALAGFGVPTVRSLLMLLAVTVALSVSRSIHPGRAWLLALAAVLLIDPFAPLAAGFWFSFGAVAALLLLFVPRCGHFSWWRSLLLAQAAVMLLMLPINAVWFQAFSWIAFAANLAAIPLVSFGVVPFVLSGVAILPVSAQMATLLWTIAAAVSSLLLNYLESIAVLQGELTRLSAPSLVGGVLAMLGAVLLLLPRGIPARWFGLFLLLPLFLPRTQRTISDALVVEMLDAGQGTAVLLRTGGHILLYDSGPGDGNGRDLVHSVIDPALHRTGDRAPDRIIISHGDLDHAGGLGSLRIRYPQAAYFGNLPRNPPGMEDCRAPLSWHWQESVFEVRHPSVALPYRGNDSSCVVTVERGGRRILLGGDISVAVEARLLLDRIPPSDVLLVPHHGSRTSSSMAFISAVRPRLAVATASLGNRFNFPADEVRQRYEDAGIPFWSTGECGALEMVLHGDGRLSATSARLLRPAIWRWPAAAACPLDQQLPGNTGSAID